MEKPQGTVRNLLHWIAEKQAKSRFEVFRAAAADDLNVVGPLAELLWDADERTRTAAEAALIRLLPRLRETDTSLLNGKQRDCLNRALRGKNSELILAILKSYEILALLASYETYWVSPLLYKMLYNVEQLAAGKGKAAKEEKIHKAAQEVLPFLRERIERETERLEGQMLLRSSSAPSVPAEALRPSPQDKPEAKT